MSDTMVCPVCGKAFIPYNIHVQKYCSAECRKKEKKRKDREYYKDYYRRGKIKKGKPLLGSRASVKSKSLDSLSGEELLHYGAMQMQENIEQLRIHKE